MNTNKLAITLLLVMGLCAIPLSVLGASPDPAPPAPAAPVVPAAPGPPIMVAPAIVRRPPAPHKFLDGPNVLIFGVSAAMMAADLATTRQALQVPGTRELNPLAHSTTSFSALKIAAFGAGIGIAYAMHKTGHHKAERIVPLVLGIPSGFAAAHNAWIH